MPTNDSTQGSPATLGPQRRVGGMLDVDDFLTSLNVHLRRSVDDGHIVVPVAEIVRLHEALERADFFTRTLLTQAHAGPRRGGARGQSLERLRDVIAASDAICIDSDEPIDASDDALPIVGIGSHCSHGNAGGREGA